MKKQERFYVLSERKDKNEEWLVAAISRDFKKVTGYEETFKRLGVETKVDSIVELE